MHTVMQLRMKSGRLHHATLLIPVCSVNFYLNVWPVVTGHDLPVKFGYRQKVRGVKSYYAHCSFQLPSLESVAEAFGAEFINAWPWGEQPSDPITPVAWKWWVGGKMDLVIDEDCPLTVYVCCFSSTRLLVSV
jgi:hypothetical protein